MWLSNFPPFTQTRKIEDGLTEQAMTFPLMHDHVSDNFFPP